MKKSISIVFLIMGYLIMIYSLIKGMPVEYMLINFIGLFLVTIGIYDVVSDFNLAKFSFFKKRKQLLHSMFLLPIFIVIIIAIINRL